MNTQYIKMSEPVISNIDLFFINIELYANDMQQLHLLKRSYCPKEKKTITCHLLKTTHTAHTLKDDSC
jgi:hypothetical protein